MGAGVTRPSDITRERILKAAERLFADHGYEETSIRAIVAKARVNQAAINYTSAARTAFIAKSCERLSARSLNTNFHMRRRRRACPAKMRLPNLSGISCIRSRHATS